MMRRFLLIVAALVFAAPAMATVNITLTNESGGVVRIDYAVTAGEDIRAFALDVNIAPPATINGVSDFFTGEGAGYGIFPGTFRDYINPATPNWGDPNYTPVAPAGDPDALGALGTSGITLEMGSLYVGEPNKPADSGTLCKLQCAGNGVGSALLTVAVNGSRGSVVLEDASAASTNLPQSITVPFECYPSSLGTQYTDWLALGSPACWCSAYQCDGDADGQVFGLLKRRVWNADYDILSANWGFQATTAGFNPCADFDHQAFGLLKRRVWNADYDILVANWGAQDSAMPGDCPKAR